MTIENDCVVDGMGIDPNTGKVALLISDHLDWDEESHFRLFEKKIGTYLEFVRSGQLVSRMPEAAGRVIVIELICQFEPSATAAQFLDAARNQLSHEQGILFEYRVLPAA